MAASSSRDSLIENNELYVVRKLMEEYIRLNRIDDPDDPTAEVEFSAHAAKRFLS